MKKLDPLVSVVVCEHNTPIDFLSYAMESILAQTYKNIEIIFVDDCSTTPYFEISLFNDNRVRVIKNRVNLGLAKSRNIGINSSNGKYICIMDTDDFSHPTRIEKQVSFMETNLDVAACGSWFKFFGKKNKTVCRTIDDNEYYRCCLLFDNSPTIINPSVMIRKQILIDHHIKLDEMLTSAEDYQLWVDLSQYGRITNIKEVLFDYRIRDGQMSEVNRTTGLSENGWRIFKNQLKMVGFSESEIEEDFLKKNYLSNDVDPMKYYRFLKEIENHNRRTHFFNEAKLNRRVKEQWTQKIYSIKNPFKLFKLFLLLILKEKQYLIAQEFKRIFRKQHKND